MRRTNNFEEQVVAIMQPINTWPIQQ